MKYHKWLKRDKKNRKKKYGMRISGASVKLLMGLDNRTPKSIKKKVKIK
jgi:hypothetical protein